MTRPIFVYGTLRDAEVLALALGPSFARVGRREATLHGYRAEAAAEGPFPVLLADPEGAAAGLLLTGADDDIRARLDAFEGEFAYALEPVEVATDGGPEPAEVYLPPGAARGTGVAWDLAYWQRNHKPLFLEMAREIMMFGPEVATSGAPRAGILRRALARLHAGAEATRTGLRSDFGAGAIAGRAVTRRATGFFALEEHAFRHRRFDGTMSPEVRREVFVTGDAVSVLPWDPASDRVLLIEQVRAGLVARGDPNPWNLEAIAGLSDRDEPFEATARREAEEEAGLALGRLAEVARFYPSPGALTEYIIAFVAEADLSGVEPGVFGLDDEHEDIRSLVVPRAEAMAALARGEVRNAPLVISLMALERERGRLSALWAG